MMVMRKLIAVLAAITVLAGCGHIAPTAPEPGITLAPPTPAGMEQEPSVSTDGQPLDQDNCTASLRPFPIRAQAQAAVANIRNRGRLIVGLDIGSNLLSFRDPITGDITGFDVDIAGEVARDIFGTPSQVVYRILSSNDRIAALQNNQVASWSTSRPSTYGRTSASWLPGTRTSRARPTCPASGCAPSRVPRRSSASS